MSIDPVAEGDEALERPTGTPTMTIHLIQAWFHEISLLQVQLLDSQIFFPPSVLCNQF